VRWLREHAGTVRFRITALATLVVFVVLAMTGIGLVAAQRELLTDGVDATLRQRADDVEVELREEPALALARSWGGREDDDNVTQLVGPDDEVLAASANIADYDAPVVDDPAGRSDHLRTVGELAAYDTEYRVLSRLVPVDGIADVGWVVVHVATDIDEIHDGAEVLTDLLVVAIPIVTALLAVVVWWLIGRTLQPVEAIRSRVALMGGGDLHRRVPEPPTDDEIARLARTMNGMLERLEAAQRRQQRFVADASHELRTPLTRIRSELEVDMAHPERADPAATRGRVLDEALGMQGLLDDLLRLAQADAGAGGADSEPVDVDDIVLREARRLRDRGRVGVDVHGVSAGQARGDSGQLARLVRNLADNAERYAATTVRFTLAEDGDQLLLVVADDGPGIPAADRERVFGRFTRLDDARTRDAGGAGLGLAIVAEIVARHGGTVTAVEPPAGDGGARLEVRLPCIPSPDPTP
jgi:signal transduction histidine kinase